MSTSPPQPSRLAQPRAMAPHMTETELDAKQRMSGAGKTSQKVQLSIGKMRARRVERVAAPDIKLIRAAMAGTSFRGGPSPDRVGPSPTRDSQLRTPDSGLRTRGSRLLSASFKNMLRNLNDELRNELRTSFGRVSQRVTLSRFACTLNTIWYKLEV